MDPPGHGLAFGNGGKAVGADCCGEIYDFVHRASTRTVSVQVSGILLRRHHNIVTGRDGQRATPVLCPSHIEQFHTAVLYHECPTELASVGHPVSPFPTLLTRHNTLYLFAVVDNKCSDKRTISCELTRDDAAVVGGRYGWGADCLKFSLVQTLIVTSSFQAFADT
jgi:hypothetical protein